MKAAKAAQAAQRARQRSRESQLESSPKGRRAQQHDSLFWEVYGGELCFLRTPCCRQAAGSTVWAVVINIRQQVMLVQGYISGAAGLSGQESFARKRGYTLLQETMVAPVHSRLTSPAALSQRTKL